MPNSDRTDLRLQVACSFNPHPEPSISLKALAPKYARRDNLANTHLDYLCRVCVEWYPGTPALLVLKKDRELRTSTDASVRQASSAEQNLLQQWVHCIHVMDRHRVYVSPTDKDSIMELAPHLLILPSIRPVFDNAKLE